MANIKISLQLPVVDGQPLTFKAPCDCSNVTGIKVEYPNGEDTAFQVFTFTDAHGNDLTGLGNLFAEGAMVKVILDTAASKAFIQNADTNAYLEGRFAELLGKAYPVGSIYMAVNDTSPADLFGGTWERLKDRFLLGAGDTYEPGETGGEAEHTLTVEEMPSHTHKLRDVDSETSWGLKYGNYVGTGSGYGIVNNAAFITKPTGGSQPHNNMPPYLAVYMWVRTA